MLLCNTMKPVLPCLNLLLLLLQTGGLQLRHQLCFMISWVRPLTEGQAAAAAGPHPSPGISSARVLLWLLLQLPALTGQPAQSCPDSDWLILENVYHRTEHTSGPQRFIYSFIAGEILPVHPSPDGKLPFSTVHCTALSICSLFPSFLFSPL